MRAASRLAWTMLAAALQWTAPERAAADDVTAEDAMTARPPYVYFSGGFGLATQAQPGFHQWFESEKRVIGASLPTGGWKTRFSPTVVPEVEAGVRASERWSFGLSLWGYVDMVENSVAVRGQYFHEWETRIQPHLLETSVHVAFWPSQVRGGYLGGRVGQARTRHYVNGGGYLDTTITNFTGWSGLWKHNATTFGMYAGWQSTWAKSPRADVRVGYDWRDFGVVGDSQWSGPDGTHSGPLLDYDGKPVAIDYSGAFVAVTLVFMSGGRR